jgi:hypothetical protein
MRPELPGLARPRCTRGGAPESELAAADPDVESSVASLFHGFASLRAAIDGHLQYVFEPRSFRREPRRIERQGPTTRGVVLRQSGEA